MKIYLVTSVYIGEDAGVSYFLHKATAEQEMERCKKELGGPNNYWDFYLSEEEVYENLPTEEFKP